MSTHAQSVVHVESDASGSRLVVDGQPFIIKGVNWGYKPVGTNHRYSLWSQPDELVQAVLDHDGKLLRDAGVNAVRIMDANVPPKWIAYLHEQYGIYTIVNHTLGRYGMTLDGQWVSPTDYSDPATRVAILAEVDAFARRYKDAPGVIAYMVGNENNYGLEWQSSEIENLPEGERQRARAEYMYSLFEEAFALIKSIDGLKPTILVNGDLQYLDLIALHCKSMDIFGTNVYRGRTFTDMYDRVAAELGKPVLLAEFGCDAYNVVTQQEDQHAQADYLIDQWRDIYRNAAGQDGAGNAIGGTVFQWNDGWWKYGQEYDLDKHNTEANWSNAAYEFDYTDGQNNMNEEWWGVTAKGPVDSAGVETRQPRASYHALTQVWRIDPLQLSASQIDEGFEAVTASPLSE